MIEIIEKLVQGFFYLTLVLAMASILFVVVPYIILGITQTGFPLWQEVLRGGL